VVVSKKALDLPKVHVSSALGMFPSLQLSAQVHVAVHALQGEFVDVGELATGVGFSRQLFGLSHDFVVVRGEDCLDAATLQ
jgi:hypothetical protein